MSRRKGKIIKKRVAFGFCTYIIATILSLIAIMFDATELLSKYNQDTGKKRRMESYMRNEGTKKYIGFLMEKTGKKLNEIYIAKQGKETMMCEELYSHFQQWLYSFNSQSFTRDEMRYGEILKNIFFDITRFESQYPCGPYFIDFYFPDLKLAVEYDEKYHKDMKEKDKKREKYITDKLGCYFYRVQSGKEIESINSILKSYFRYDFDKKIDF